MDELDYNFHRYYLPELGRYLRSDPIRLKGGINEFEYSYSNPLNNFDPNGKAAIVPVLIELPLLFCLRFPRICKEIKNCFLNPQKCKGKFCKAGNRLYEFCKAPGLTCNTGDGCASSSIKLSILEGCYGLRLATGLFCNKGNRLPDENHEGELAKLLPRIAKCRGVTSDSCSTCFIRW